MKDFICSSLILLLLIGSWMGFLYYSTQEIQKMTETIQDTILPSIEKEHWQDSIHLMDNFQKRWKTYQKTALYFSNTEQLNDIDSSIAKTMKYIQAEDISNSSGELLAVSHQLSALNSQAKLTLQNIF